MYRYHILLQRKIELADYHTALLIEQALTAPLTTLLHFVGLVTN